MTKLSKNTQVPQCDKTAVSSSTLLDFVIEFNSHWSDGVVDYEQTINIKAENKKVRIADFFCLMWISSCQS